MRRKIKLLMTFLLLIGMILVSKKLSNIAVNGVIEENLVVIDAGHGGEDPGKVGVNGALEKDINLQIARRLQSKLEGEGVAVVMTRTEDIMDGSKNEDMRKRVSKINEIMPRIVISIHQNSYTSPNVKGAQVFYYSDSKESKEAASIMQQELKVLDPENKRQIKSDHTFFMLKKTKVPIIIVECGFLSNPEEAKKLVLEEYQEKLSATICNGIIKWLDK